MVLAARKNPLVSPAITMRSGSSKNTYTGMKMMNMPYQPRPTHRYCAGMAR